MVLAGSSVFSSIRFESNQDSGADVNTDIPFNCSTETHLPVMPYLLYPYHPVGLLLHVSLRFALLAYTVIRGVDNSMQSTTANGRQKQSNSPSAVECREFLIAMVNDRPGSM